MEPKKTYIPKDERGCYRVPEGYFDNLNASIVEKTQTTTESNNSWGTTMRRMMGFVAGFAVLVALAAAALYLTPSEAIEEHKQSAQNATVEEFTTLYAVSEDDILDYYYPSKDELRQENAQFAQAIDEYLTNYPIANITEEDFNF